MRTAKPVKLLRETILTKHEDGLDDLMEALGHSFYDRALLMTALTHTSYANEHRKDGILHNERLEFLGDAVLEMVSSEYLYKLYPRMKEGELSKLRASLVCEPTLAVSAHELDLTSYLRLGKGEEKTGGRFRDSILSDALESVIAAIYLDGGFEAARRFILDHILNDIERKRQFNDSKSDLQEAVQARGGKCDYKLVSEDGPDHDKTFTVDVLIDGEVFGRGTGRTKKAAEQMAALEALKRFRCI